MPRRSSYHAIGIYARKRRCPRDVDGELARAGRLRCFTSPSGAIRARAKSRLRTSASRARSGGAGQSEERLARTRRVTLEDRSRRIGDAQAWGSLDPRRENGFRLFFKYLADYSGCRAGEFPAIFEFPRISRAAAEWTECATMRHFCSICRFGLSLCAGRLFRHFGDSTTDFGPKSARKAAISASFRSRE